MEQPTARDRYLSIPLNPVESSNISSIGFEDGTLAVEFKSGAVHHYQDVPAIVYREFESALSKGVFYSMNVRGKYTSVKLTGECNACGSKPGLIGSPCIDCSTGRYVGECGDAWLSEKTRCTLPEGHDSDLPEAERVHAGNRKKWITRRLDGGAEERTFIAKEKK